MVDNQNDKKSRLKIYQSTWGMEQIPSRENAWSIQEQIAKIESAGFDGIQQYIQDASAMNAIETVFKAQRENNLELGISCTVRNAAAFQPIAKIAKLNHARFINVMVADYFVTGDEAIKNIIEIQNVAAQYELPLFIETHRNTITQDLLRTIDYLRAIDDMKLTLDLSHYVLCSEIMISNKKIEEAFDILFNRAGSIHARISNGHQIQVSINEFHDSTNLFAGWWQQIMQKWLIQAGPADTFYFTVELGPPAYGILIPKNSNDHEKMELYDRWEEALSLKDMAKQLWAEIV